MAGTATGRVVIGIAASTGAKAVGVELDAGAAASAQAAVATGMGRGRLCNDARSWRASCSCAVECVVSEYVDILLML